MKLKQFLKIEKEINQTFSEKYSGIRSLLYFSSFFGNAMSILLAFFFMSKLLTDSVSFVNSKALIYVISLLILTGLELFKRSLFTKFSIEFVSSKFDLLKREVAMLASASVLIIGLSFYSTLTGAAEFTSKDTIITQNTDQQLKIYSDSVNAEYLIKIKDIEGEIKQKKEKIEKKDEEQTQIQMSQRLNRTQQQRVKDLKDEKSFLKSEVNELSNKISDLKSESDQIVNKYKSEVESKSTNEKEKNSDNSFVFIIISTIVEFLILIGIYFDKHYKWVSYNSYKKKINNDPSYQKWNLYNGVLDCLYNSDTQVGEKVSSMSNLIDICKTNGVLITNRELSDCLKLFTNLKILKLSGSARYISKDKISADESLRENFKID